MRVDDCDSDVNMKVPKDQVASPLVNLSLTNMRQQPLIDYQ